MLVDLPLLQGATNMVFSQDKARPDVARRIFNSLTGFNIISWPANSSDLNPIKLLRDLLRSERYRGPLTQTVDDLHKAMYLAWQRLPQATINGLIDRISRRIETCIAARGGHISCD
ncbi:hypothetical protein TNCV_4934831 [Trichonephila clavipes]|uniref:Tc1-like transposase DDE domain-containing protein n=1 Tax=Trichonephila clavipes TaxID=2585209 RepID=A0A8X6SEM6_TRICX|nr:hypothetical protein TNCV_4934831 [Trichonephila clavipes]